jgi:hypothetical protein
MPEFYGAAANGFLARTHALGGEVCP